MKAIRRAEILLFFLFFVSSAYFFQGGFDNLNSHFDLSLSLAFDHTLSIDSFKDNTVDRALFGGHYYSEKPPGLSYLALPVPLVASTVLTTKELLARPGLADSLLYLATLLSVGALSALGGVFFRRSLKILNPTLDERKGFLFAIIYFFGTLIFPYSTMLFSHGATAGLISVAVYLGLKFNERPRRGLAFVFGGALGLAVLCEAPLAIVAAILMAAFLWRGRAQRTVALAIAGSAAFAFLLLFHNWLSFGSPFVMGYIHLESSSYFTPGMSQGFFGLVAPDWRVVFNLLLSSYRGLFVFTPVLLFPTLVLIFPGKDLGARLPFVFIFAVAAHLLLISSYHFWQGGVAFGPRHLVPIIPLLALGFAGLHRAVNRWWVLIPFAILSFAINFVGTLTTPFIDEDDASPLFSAYKYLVENHGIAINPMHFLTPTADAKILWKQTLTATDHGAFNLGQLIGLDGWASLAPLVVFWGLMGFFIFKKSDTNHG